MRNIGPIYQAPKGTIIRLGMDYLKGGIKRYALRVKQQSLGAFLESLNAPPQEKFDRPVRQITFDGQ